MREFFINNNHFFEYDLFGFNHIVTMLMAVIPMILIYIFRHKIGKISEDKSRKILIVVASLILATHIIYNFSFIIYGIYDYKIHLPIHLCFLSNFLFIYAIYSKKDELLKYTFLLSFVGPIPAILWPDIPSSWDCYEFYQYFFSHHIFIVFSFYSYFALKYEIKFVHLIRSIILVNLLVLLLIPFNIIFDMNYIFSTEIPAHIINIYPFVKYFNPLFIIELTGITIVIILYIFIKKINAERNFTS